MSFRKNQKKSLPEDNPFFSIKARDKGKILELTLKEQEDEDRYDEIKGFCDDNLTSEKKGINKIYLLKANELDDFLETIESVAKGEYKEEEEESDSDTSTDDETVARALARRFKNKSPMKVITEETVEDSDMEMPATICQRLRHVYARMKELEKRIEELEKKIN